MIRKVTLVLLAFITCFHYAQAQRCGFDARHQQMLAQDPGFTSRVQQMNSQINTMVQSNPNALIVNTPNGPVYEIPLVIHVIHTGGAIGTVYNPSDAQLIAMVNYLNQTFSASWPAYPNPSSGGTFIPLQFVLAKRTPQCTPTNGIVRVNGSSVPNYAAGGINLTGIGADEEDVKDLSRWPIDQYYNIWIVNRIDGEDGLSGSGPYVAGFAYFPDGNPATDGTVMLATQANAGEETLPHEIGHAFALYHTFEGDLGGTTCPPNTNCSNTGDRVCDTDPHIQTQFNCPTGINPCTGNPFGNVVRNIMDYSNCKDRFTPGQRDRLISALLASPTRSSLISSLGGTPLPATSIPAACIPATSGGTGNAGPRDITIANASVTHMAVTSSGYSGDGGVAYLDRTCEHMVELMAGNIYNFSVATGPNTENVKVFVDYNNDGTFQSTEEIFSSAGTTSNQVHSFQYTVPTTATVPGLVSCTPLRMRVMSDRTIAAPINVCGPLQYGQAEDYLISIRGGGPSTGSVSIALTTGTNPSCFNAPLTFTATPALGITATSYQWWVNGTNTGVTTNTYSNSTLANNDIVKVKMYFTGPCGVDSAWSTDFTVQRQATVPATVTIALTGGTNPGCAGQLLTFTATPQNGGTAPSYQWWVNGGNVGTNSNVFSSSTLANNDVVSVQMTSNSSCASPATATSNTITIVHGTITADVTIQQVDGTNPTCAGSVTGFEAQATNAGANPQYQWFVNGVAVAGATQSSYTTTTLTNNDVVTAVLTSTDPCVSNPSDTSAGITMTINPTDTPNVVIDITAGSNPGCLDSLIEFTATITNHGLNPNTAWYVNGIQVATGTVYSTNSLHNGDVVTFSSMANDGACYTEDTVVTAPITMALFSTPPPPVFSLIGNMLVSNVPNTIWYGPNGDSVGTGATFQPTENGTYYVRATNGGCLSAPSSSFPIFLDVEGYDMTSLKVYPNPTSGMLQLDWGTSIADVTLDVYNMNGQGLMHEKVAGQSRKMLNLQHFANGTYFVVIRDRAGKMGTLKVVIQK